MDRTGKWASISQLNLSEPMRQELQQKMPGYQSFLHRHEWVKHGTCLPGLTTEEYFRASLKLLDDFNSSAVRQLFEANIGSEIDARSIRREMDKSFGRGAGNRLRIACRRDGTRRIITELTIGLTGDIGQETDMASLISGTGLTDAGCPGGFVDAVGYQ